jgi:ribosome-associated toxin RatA of RatAB toxin-antitoxin module
MQRSLLLAMLGLPLLVRPAAADTLDKIKTGKIVVQSLSRGSGPKAGRASAIIEAPAEVVAKIIADVARYPEFVPRCTDSRKVRDGSYVVFTKLPWPLRDTWAYIKMTRTDRSNLRYLSWKMLNGTLRSYEGQAWVQPLDARRSVLTYQMLAVPLVAGAPDSLISSGLRDAVKTMVKALRERAAEVLARQPAPGKIVAAQ